MSTGSSPEMILLHAGSAPEGARLPLEYIFAWSTSEDDLNVNTKTDGILSEGEIVTYSGEAINEANLVSDRGERIIWRETKPGDYPPLEQGVEMRPIQQSLKLV